MNFLCRSFCTEHYSSRWSVDRDYVDWLAEQLQLKQLNEWYSVEKDVIESNGGGYLLSKFGGSHIKALVHEYPDTEWHLWRFCNVPNKFWEDPQNQREYLLWIADQFDIRCDDDWYKVRKVDIVKKGGAGFFNKFSGSHIVALQRLLSEKEWQEWNFDTVPKGYWTSEANRRKFVDELGERLQIQQVDDWYKVRHNSVRREGGSGFLEYHGTLASALMTLYSHTQWQPWRFEVLPEDYWENLDHQRQYFDYLAEQLNIYNDNDWYAVKYSSLLHKTGSYLLEKFYENSLGKALETVYPERTWQVWRFERIHEGFWEEVSSCRAFLDWVAEQHGVVQPYDWYSLKQWHLITLGGQGLLHQFEYSIIKMLLCIYGDTEWHLWKFDSLPAKFWHEVKLQRQYFDWLADELDIEYPNGWYRVKKNEIIRRKGSELLALYEGYPFRALQEAYPDTTFYGWVFDTVPANFWDDLETRRDYFLWLARELSIARLEDWYTVNIAKMEEMAGYSLVLNYYESSYLKALSLLFPGVWYPWLVGSISSDWDNVVTQRNFVHYMERRLHLGSPEDWYTVTVQDVEANGGKDYLMHRKMSTLLHAVYPHVGWQPWILDEVDDDDWQDIEVQVHYVEWLAGQLGLKTVEDWHRVQVNDIILRRGSRLLQLYENSASKMLRVLYPEVPWQPWIFGEVEKGYWQHREHRQQFFDWLGKRLNVQETINWYKWRKYDIERWGGAGLLDYHAGSPIAAIKEVYPHVDWKLWLFDHAPADRMIQRSYFDWVAEQLHVCLVDDWYMVNKYNFKNLSGSGLLKFFYGGSVSTALAAMYPFTAWQAWRFVPLARNFWENFNNQRQYMRWVEGELEINRPEDWYGFTKAQLSCFYGSSLIDHAGSLVNLVAEHYRHVEWDQKKWLSHVTSKAHKFLFKALKSVLPKDVELEFNHTTWLKYPDSNKCMEFDIWIPQYNLFMEYQGEQHYFPNLFGPSRDQVIRDRWKLLTTSEHGFGLLAVPYWWDLKDTSLSGHLQQHCAECVGVDSNHSGIPRLYSHPLERQHGLVLQIPQ